MARGNERRENGVTAPADGQLLLEVNGLTKFYPIRCGFLRRVVGQVRAVADVSFDIRRG